MVGYPQPLEEFLEVVALVDVIIGSEHAKEDALAKAARADEEQEMIGVFHNGEILRLIDEIKTLAPKLLEVGDAVWEKLDRCHRLLVLVLTMRRYAFLVTSPNFSTDKTVK